MRCPCQNANSVQFVSFGTDSKTWPLVVSLAKYGYGYGYVGIPKKVRYCFCTCIHIFSLSNEVLFNCKVRLNWQTSAIAKKKPLITPLLQN